jgi:phage terminase large subunit-like protein
VFARFVNARNPEKPFVPARIADNPHLDAEQYRKGLAELAEGVRRQLEDGDWRRPDVDGALWKSSLFEREGFRRSPVKHLNEHDQYALPPDIDRVVVAVDPTVTQYDDEETEALESQGRDPQYPGDRCGVMVVGLTRDARGVVLADLTGFYSPAKWAKVVVRAYRRFQATSIVIETNQGGALVKQTLENEALCLPIVEVRASMGKRARAEPVAALYENGRFQHAGIFSELEAEMTTWDAKRPGSKSPNRVDALVWAAHALGMCNATGVRRSQGIVKSSSVEH